LDVDNDPEVVGTSLDGSSGIGASTGVGTECALDSFLDFRPLLENIEPNICTLSGRSDFVEGILPLLLVDLLEDFRDSVSFPAEPDSRDRNEGVVEVNVLDLEPPPRTDPLRIDSVYARILSGEGGPSIAGPSELVEALGFVPFLGCDGLPTDCFLPSFLGLLIEYT
jgi:hypothetical protein